MHIAHTQDKGKKNEILVERREGRIVESRGEAANVTRAGGAIKVS